MINIDKLFYNVRKHFQKNLPDFLFYHNWQHTLSVYRNVQHIGLKENLRKSDIDLLKIAALFHDIGYIEHRVNHEQRGCEIMEDWFRNEDDVSEADIQLLKGMIMATKIPQKPCSHLEKVLADADLLYLGTIKYKEVSEKLFKEFQHHMEDLDSEKWHNLQVAFLESHTFHTAFCLRYYTWKEKKNLKKVIEDGTD